MKKESKRKDYIKREKIKNIEIKNGEQILSPYDKITWSYKVNKKLKILEITTVAYVTTIGKKNYTIIYYDNSHDGTMHSHLRVSVKDPSDSPIELRVKKKGNQGNLMHWAIKDIMNNWYFYKKKFFARSKLKMDF